MAAADPGDTTLNEAIDAAVQRNASNAGVTADKTYEYNWKRYKKFVDEKRREGVIPQGGLYLTRRNVDYFFQEFVSQMNVDPKVAARIRPSLQFYADRFEHVLVPFEVDSVDVRGGLSSQVVTYIQKQIGRKVDPHANLPCTMLTPEEHHRALHTMLTNQSSQWQSLCSSWNIGTNSFMHCDTFVKLRLPSMYLNTSHGPKLPNGKKEPIITFILNSGDMKGGGGGPRGGKSKSAIDKAKEKASKKKTGKNNDDNEEEGYGVSKKKRMTGLWRHKEWLRCGVGMLAMSLFTLLYHEGKLNFYDEDRKKIPSWWKRKIWSQWKDTKVAGTVYKRLLNHCNINWGKVVHMRTTGIEYASSQGELDGGAVGTMSKHQSSKLEKVYMTELFAPVLRVMSGFEKDENYYVPRILLKLPWSESDLCAYIFPKLHVWLIQYKAPNGDHSLAAENFLTKLLPYLAKVVVQDGIYWIKHYLKYEASKLLLNVMPPEYERWAANARKEIDDLVANKRAVLTSDLNAAAKAALLTVLDRMDVKFSEQSVEMSTLTMENRELRKSVADLISVLEKTHTER